MAVNPKVQLTRLLVGIAGAAAVAGLAGRLATGPAQVAAAPDEGAVAPEALTEEEAPSFFAWFDHDHEDDDDDDDDDDDELEEGERHARAEGKFQFAQPGGTSVAPGSSTAVPNTQQPRARSKRS
jgi:hypothetical protein